MKNMFRNLLFAVLACSTFMTVAANSASMSSSSARPSFSSPSSTYSKPIISAPSNSYSKPVAAAPAPSYSKPAAPPATTTSNSTSQTYSKPGGATSPQPTVKTTTPLGIAQSKQISSQSLNSYKAERANAKTPPTPIDAKSVSNDPGLQAARKQYGSTDQYMTQRTTNITVYRAAHPDVFVYTHNMYPYYGAYDNSFLIGMMFGYVGSSMSNANWLYMHQNDPWYYQWHQDMLQQAQTDAMLKAKLQQMDEQLTQLKAQNAHPVVAALPEGADPSVAIAPEAMLVTTAEQPEPHMWFTFLIWFSVILLIAMIGGGYYLYRVGKNN